MPVFLDKHVILIHLHAVAVRKDIDFADDRSRMFTGIHRRAYSYERLTAACCRINGCRDLGISEHVAYAMMTDPVTASELLVGVVIRKTPADRARDAFLAHSRVKNVCMTQGVLEAVLFRVKRLRRKHVPVVFGDEISLVHVGSNLALGPYARVVTRMRKVIERVNVL